MKSNNKSQDKLENPVIYWGSIGVAISSSTAAVMKFEWLGLVLSVAAGLVAGLVIGYLTKQAQEKEQEL